METGRAARIKRTLNSRIVVPRPTPRQFYGHGVPKVNLDKLAGRLIVVEGADGSGRSTQIAHLVQWLEGGGHATVQVGLKRSSLVSEELEQAKQGNILDPWSFTLLYATSLRALPLINRGVELAPAAQACCGACRTCVTTNLLTLASAAAVGAAAYVSRVARRAR